MKILIDTKGGDYAPYEIVMGAIEASRELEDPTFVLFGDEKEINKILRDNKADMQRFEIVDSPECVENTESPTMAIKTKKNSSMVKAFDRLKTDPEVCGMISCGSTGAILTGSILKIGRIKGVSRPSLAPVLATQDGGKVIIIDSGANMDCKPQNLCHFAIMGSEYMRVAEGVEKPRVALLNVGTEDKKGNDLCHETFDMLKALDINFVGNMEARDALSGKYDVIVADGFAGNVLIKSLECALETCMLEIKTYADKSLKAKLGALLLRPSLRSLKHKYDFNKVGGSMFIGASKLVLKCHGASKRGAICACCHQLMKLYKNNINNSIESAVIKANTTLEGFSS